MELARDRADWKVLLILIPKSLSPWVIRYWYMFCVHQPVHQPWANNCMQIIAINVLYHFICWTVLFPKQIPSWLSFKIMYFMRYHTCTLYFSPVYNIANIVHVKEPELLMTCSLLAKTNRTKVALFYTLEFINEVYSKYVY